METGARAHLEKKAFIERLLSQGERGPLALLTMNRDGQPYLRMHRVSYLMGMVGLNELVKIHTGEELHASEQAFRFGLKVIAHMKLMTDKLSRHHNMHFVLEQTPAESTAYRFAKLDLKYYSPQAGHAVAAGEAHQVPAHQEVVREVQPANDVEFARQRLASPVIGVAKSFRQTHLAQLAQEVEVLRRHRLLGRHRLPHRQGMNPHRPVCSISVSPFENLGG